MSGWALATAGVIGAVMGTINTLALWFTVLAVPSVRRPGLLLAGGFVVRTALTLGPVVALGLWHPARLMVGLAAFVAVRFVTAAVLGARETAGAAA